MGKSVVPAWGFPHYRLVAVKDIQVLHACDATSGVLSGKVKI